MRRAATKNITSKTISEIGEFGLIGLLRELIQKEGHSPFGVILGIGDDAACFAPRSGFSMLVTCDSLVENRHYMPGHLSARDLGRRAMALNISDIGAMGGVPLYAFISLGLKADTSLQDVLEMYRGFIFELNPFGAGIQGGNLTQVAAGPFIDITLIGEIEKELMVKRSGAKPGDKILVTGFPGESNAGLLVVLKENKPIGQAQNALIRAYCRPVHRAREGRVLAQTGLVTAMIDTSDGLLGDLGHICEQSRVGALLIQEHLPVSPLLKEAAKYLALETVDLVLQPSDDYELIFTCPAGAVSEIRAALKKISSIKVTEIGTMTDAQQEISLLLPTGEKKSLKPLGWDHFRKK